MSIDLGLVPMTPQTGHCARAASQALLKELLCSSPRSHPVELGVHSAGQHDHWGRAAPQQPPTHDVVPGIRRFSDPPRRGLVFAPAPE
jgi:hypothetical protein